MSLSVVSVVTSPFYFLILLIWAFSLFILMSLAKGLSILSTFSKNQLLVSLIFAIVFFVSILFISALFFMISFLPLTSGFVYSSFSSCIRYMLKLFIWDFSCFLRIFLNCKSCLLWHYWNMLKCPHRHIFLKMLVRIRIPRSCRKPVVELEQSQWIIKK